MNLNTQKCDMCGKLRELVLGVWWLGLLLEEGLTVVKYIPGDPSSDVHLCCLKCAGAWVDSVLKKLTPSVEEVAKEALPK